jgi:cell division protein FtsB
MFSLRKKRNFWYYAKTGPALLALSVAFVFVGRAAFRIYEKERVSGDDLTKTESQYKEYSLRAATLESEIARLKSNRGVEEEIRNKFRLAKDGEKMVVIVEPKEISTSTPEVKKDGLWERFVNFFTR